MYVWSKALAVALVVTLWGYGATTLQAKDHKDKDQNCPHPQAQGCPAPQLQKPAPIESACCPMPSVQSHCEAPVQTGCCPVDPKEVSKAEKEALHAQHEAAEACERQQKAIAKAQDKLEEKYAKEQSRIDKANAKLNDRVSELQEANARYESFFGGPSVTTAEVTPQPTPAPEITQPLPEPAPRGETTPAQPTVEENVAILETPPAPSTQAAPEPAPVETKPKELPKTASPMSLIGLIGVLSMSSYTATRFFLR